MARTAHIVRETSESHIELSLNLDGTGKTDIDTSVPFYNHMMNALGKHSLIDLTIHAHGDTDIDVHHTVEDAAIVFGEALKQALGDKRGIRRFADATVPLDEALAKAVVDISGRPYCVCSGEPDGFEYCMIGGHFTGSLVRHVMESIAFHAGICLHMQVLAGRDPHHIAGGVRGGAALRGRAGSAHPGPDPQHEGRTVMSGNDDRHGGDDGFDDDIHFSDEELEAALDGFEKEFRDSNAAAGEPANDAAADSPADDAGAADSGQAQEADTAAAFDDELQGLLGNKAKAAVLITRVASARLLAAFCQLSDVSADCIGSEEGAVAILRNLDGDGPEVAARDLTIVVSGMSLVLAVNRADKLEATVYLQGKPGQTIAPPLLFTSTAPFVEDLLLGITDEDGLIGTGMKVEQSADLDHDQAMAVIAEHMKFGRGSSRIE